MHAPPTARTYAVGVGRSARRLAQRHAADAAQAALALAAVALAAVLASYLLWAWRDIDFACAARHSEHCTAPVADPAMRASRDQLCRMRAADCAHNFASLPLPAPPPPPPPPPPAPPPPPPRGPARPPPPPRTTLPRSRCARSPTTRPDVPH